MLCKVNMAVTIEILVALVTVIATNVQNTIVISMVSKRED